MARSSTSSEFNGPFETKTDLNEGNLTEILLGSDDVTMNEISTLFKLVIWL